jgi:hypothetical protein
VKSLSKKLATAALATGLAFTGVVASSPAAQAYPVIGTGVVDIYGPMTNARCEADGLADGCWEQGAGVVVDNQWSDNEVLTVDHVVRDMVTVYIYDPYSEHQDYGYVQRVDVASDLAVVWIYKSYDPPTNHFTRSDYTYQTSLLTLGNPNTGVSVKTEGDANENQSHPGMYFTSGHGTIIDNNYNGYPVNGCNSGMGHCYNEIQTTRSTDKGDSGGPEIDQGGPYDTNVGKVIGLNDMIDANYSYAIQVGLLHERVTAVRPLVRRSGS